MRPVARVALLLLLGCGGAKPSAKPAVPDAAPASRCDRVADHVVAVEGDPGDRARIAHDCAETWTPDESGCVLAATSVDAIQQCLASHFGD